MVETGEIGIDIYILICIKWITNKNLLYKKINKIRKFKNKNMVVTGISSRSLYCQQWNHEEKKSPGKGKQNPGLATQLCTASPPS